MDLRANTAVDVLIGPFVDSTDGNTTEDGLTLSQADIKLSKNGQALAQKTDATSAVFDDDGYYNCELDATDTNTEGQLVLIVHETGALPVRHEYNVMAEAAWDSLYAAKDVGFMDVNIKTVGRADAQETEANNLESACSNYSVTRGLTGTAVPAAVADAAGGLPISDAGGLDLDSDIATLLTGTPTTKYMGYYGPGVYIDSGAGNVNTVVGTDGTINNPVSTFAAARTIANSIGLNRYYLEGNSDITLAATHVDWEFCGVGAVADNTLNFGSQDVSRSRFCNLTLEGTQGGAGRIEAIECALQDPGAGATTLHIFALRCGLVDDIEIDTSNNNVFDSCYSLVAGATTPAIIATGAAGTLEIRHYSGGIELKTLSASHNVSIEGMGQVVFNADCNVNANVSIRGLFTITDNTAGMASLTQDAVVNMLKINTEADTALTDYDPPTKAEMDTAHALLATEAKQDIIDTNIDQIETAVITNAAGADISADILTIDNLVDDLESRLTAARAGYLDELAAANIPADIDTLLTRITAAIATKAEMDTAHGLLATPAQVNTQVSDVIKTDTKGEPAQGAPGATLSLEDKIAFIYKFLRNKITDDGTDIEVYNDAGAVVDHKAPVSEAAGTVTRGEFISGP